MSGFVIPTEPLAGESLMGFVARACERNGHPSIVRVLGLAGFETFVARFLPISETVDLERMANFFGCKGAELKVRMQSPIEVGLQNTFISYFGSPFRRFMREPFLRRVSPASLRVSPHHRAISILRPLLYCPESGELLTSNCPNPDCRKSLGWKYAQGVPFCEYCLDADGCPTTDLRDLELPRLVGDELALYRSVAGLLTGHTDAMRALPPFFASWHGWEVFDMIAMLGNILCRRFPDRAKVRSFDCIDLPDWHQNLMSAARVVMNWPEGFGDLVELLNEATGARSGFYGRFKELGPLADFGISLGALPKVKDAIKNAISGHYAAVRGSGPERSFQAPPERATEVISYREAIAKYGVTSYVLSSIAENEDIEIIKTGNERYTPTYFNERQLVELLESRRSVLLIDRLVLITGLPLFAIKGLVESRHIHLAAGPLARFRDPSVQPAEIDRFRSRLEANASNASASGGRPLMKMALHAGSTGGGLLLKLVQLCLDGRIEYSLSPNGTGIISRVVLSAKAIEFVETWADEVAPVPVSTKMTREDVSMYLDLPYEDVIEFVKAGVLRAERRRVTGESVQRFNEEYITSSTVAKRMNIRVTKVERVLDGYGIRPAHSVGRRSTAVAWRRTDVMPIIEQGVFPKKRRSQAGMSKRRPPEPGGDHARSNRRSSEAAKPEGAASNE
jgi:hypothetical protein